MTTLHPYKVYKYYLINNMYIPTFLKGILALTNHVLPGVVYAWTAVLVLPINSALNPFLYTVTAILGKKVGIPYYVNISENTSSRNANKINQSK